MPPLTAYYVMRVGKLPLVPYFAPGDPTLAEAVQGAAKHSAVLLANHGPVVAGSSLRPRSMRSRSWRRPPSSTCCCKATRPAT